MMKANENNYVELIKKRREEGLLYVIDTYGSLLYSIVRRRLFTAPDRVDECMNDIFLGIWENINSFDGEKGSFEGWAAGVARLEAIDMLRRIQRELRFQAVPLEGVEIPQEDVSLLELTELELSGETKKILECLNPKDRELFCRIFMGEEEPEKAGAALGISRDNVYVRIFRGKQKIRRKFKERKRA